MRRQRDKDRITRQKYSKQSTSTNLSSRVSIYDEIKLKMSKFLEHSHNQFPIKKSKRKSMRQSINEKIHMNMDFDLNQTRLVKPIINNYTNICSKQQHGINLAGNNSNIRDNTLIYAQDRKYQNTPKKSNNNSNNMTTKKAEIQKKSFLYKYIIGKGGFGKVWKVQLIKNKTNFAMKEMLKSIVLSKKSVQSIVNQQKILSYLRSEFIVNMHYAFQDRQMLYLVLDLMEGGDLRHHLSSKRFNEAQAKFFIACLVQGLEYIHKKNIIHRDIKPENLVLDSSGYLRITDFGIARTHRSNNSSDTSGTPGYMSPEVICRQNHSFVADFFAVGVIAYELMLEKRPYSGYSRAEIRANMLGKQASIKPYQLPQNWSPNAISFVNKLLQRKPQLRLGFNNVYQIKMHPWLADIDWDKLAKKQISAPYVPLMKKQDFDQDEQITIENQQQGELIQKNALLLRRQDFQDLFKQYNFELTQPTPKKTQRKKQVRPQTVYLNKKSDRMRIPVPNPLESACLMGYSNLSLKNSQPIHHNYPYNNFSNNNSWHNSPHNNLPYNDISTTNTNPNSLRKTHQNTPQQFQILFDRK